MQFPDAGHPRLSRGHIRFPGGWLLQRGTEHAPPLHSHLPRETRGGGGNQLPIPPSELSTTVSMPRSSSPQPPLLFLLPTQRSQVGINAYSVLSLVQNPNKTSTPLRQIRGARRFSAGRTGQLRALWSHRLVGPRRRRGRVGSPLGVLGADKVVV